MTINQKAWQPNTGTTYVQVSHRITNTEQIKVAGANTNNGSQRNEQKILCWQFLQKNRSSLCKSRVQHGVWSQHFEIRFHRVCNHNLLCFPFINIKVNIWIYHLSNIKTLLTIYILKFIKCKVNIIESETLLRASNKPLLCASNKPLPPASNKLLPAVSNKPLPCASNKLNRVINF